MGIQVIEPLRPSNEIHSPDDGPLPVVPTGAAAQATALPDREHAGSGVDGPGEFAAPDDSSAPRPAVKPRPGVAMMIRRIVLLLFITTAATAGIVSYQVVHSRSLSPVDEFTYVDSLAKVHTGHFVIGRGEQLGLYVSNAIACRGILPFVAPRPTVCDSHSGYLYPARNTADIDPPTYYAMTDVGARALMAVGVTRDLVNAGRLVGIFWGGAGLAAVFWLCLLLGASRTSSALVCAVALATAGSWNPWSQVTPHASDVLIGALVSIAVLLWARRRAPGWLLLMVGAVPVMFKASNVTVIAAVLVFLLALALWPGFGTAADQRRLRSRRELLLGAAMIVAGLAVATVGWLLVRDHYSLSTVNDFPEFNTPAFRVQWLLDSLGAFAQSFQSLSTTGLAPILVIWMFGSVVHQLSDRSDSLEIRSLSFAGLTVAIFGAWLYVVSNYVLLHQSVVIPARYGTTLMPVLLALTARNIRSRVAQLAALVYVILMMVNAFHPI